MPQLRANTTRLPSPELMLLLPSSSSPRPPPRPPRSTRTTHHMHRLCTHPTAFILFLGDTRRLLLCRRHTPASSATHAELHRCRRHTPDVGTRHRLRLRRHTPSSTSHPAGSTNDPLPQRYHWRLCTGRHTARRPRLAAASALFAAAPNHHCHHAAGRRQRAFGERSASHDELALIPIVGTEDRRTITRTRDMAMNAPAAERPVCWLLLFPSAQPK